jgi:Flp pilus assembly protein TadD
MKDERRMALIVLASDRPSFGAGGSKMTRNKIIGTSLFILLSIFISGCAQVKYVINWFSSPMSGHDSSKAAVETATGLSGKEVDMVYAMACYLQDRKQYSLSINEFQKVVASRPCYAKAYNGMGVSYDQMRDYASAVQSYEKALEIDPGLDYVHNNLAYCYSLQGMTDNAIAEYKKAIELNPSEVRYHNNLGKAYAAKGNYDLAVAEFRKTTDEAGARSLLAKILYENGSYKEAAVQFTEASKLAPDDDEMRKGIKASSNLAKINKEDRPLGKEVKEAMQVKSSPKDADVEQINVPGPPSVRVKITGDEPDVGKKASVSTPAADQFSAPVSMGNPSYTQASKEHEGFIEARRENPSSTQDKKRGMMVELISDFPNHPVIKKIYARLIKMGFSVKYLKNTGSYGHSESKLYYFPERLQEAYQAAKQVPGYQNMYKVQTGDDKKIQVVIGSDLVPVSQAEKKTATNFGG